VGLDPPYRSESVKEPNMYGAGGRLPPTSWTLLAAAQGEGNVAAVAREEFVRRYYPPVHAYLAAILRDADNRVGWVETHPTGLKA
jgi:hypothetical protein